MVQHSVLANTCPLDCAYIVKMLHISRTTASPTTHTPSTVLQFVALSIRGSVFWRKFAVCCENIIENIVLFVSLMIRGDAIFHPHNLNNLG